MLVTLIIFLVLSDKHFIPRMILAWRWVKSMMHRPKPKEEEPAANVPTEETTEPTETDETDKEDGNTVVVFTNTGTDEPEPDVILEDEPETTETTESTETTEPTDEIQITYTPTADEEAVTEDEPEATAETEAEDPDLTINKPDDDTTCIKNDLQEVIEVHDGALATSGNYRNYYIQNGHKIGHTIDPKTGYPAQQSILSSTVKAPSCAMADGYATAFMVMGMKRSQDFLKEHPQLQAYFIYANEDGQYQTWHTPNFYETEQPE